MTLRELERLPPPQLEGIRKIQRERCVLRESFLDTVRRFAHLSGTVALMSGGDHDCARYHILGVFPWLSLRAKSKALEVTKQVGGETRRFHQDPFDLLEQLLDQYACASVDANVPLQAGLLGYLAYDLKDCLEQLPRTSLDDLGLPDLYMVAPGLLLVQEKQTGESTLFVPEFHGEASGAGLKRLGRFEAALNQPPPTWRKRPAKAAFSSGFSRSEYMQAVESIRRYIAQGDVYQVNMSQRFAGEFAGDPFELYAEMYQANPAAFFSYINAGDHQVVSTSPERFIRLEDGLVETRPIKGTRPRGASVDEDSRLREELEGSRKDDAELSMIVDLLRNDIGKVCRAGSVRVSAHKRVEGYKNVYHLVSVVEGTLDEGRSAVDLIRATFPGGSITGCPKIRSMEVIDELEPVRRHVYTGSIGYLSFHGSLDLSIAIRTATISRGQLVFSVGGGITYDSDPSLEYEETLHKGRTLMKALGAIEAGAAPAANVTSVAKVSEAIAWQDGRFAALERLSVPVMSEGFQYGYGFFETLRVERGRPILLEAHVERFARAWRRYFVAQPPEVGWHDVIAHLIAANGLQGELAAVKILAAAGTARAPRFDGTLLVTARVYQPPAALTDGFALLTYPEVRHTPLAAHKTMNYMFYKLAGDWAKQQGADAALILNADQTVSETNAANLFCAVQGTLYCPASAHVLPGVMAASVRQLWARWGQRIEERQLSLAELKRADQVFLTNSLLGAAPVTQIDGEPIPTSGALCDRINRAVFP